MYRNREREDVAKGAADHIRQSLQLETSPSIGLVLGTGWGDALALENVQTRPYSKISGFNRLESLEGHKRKILSGTIADIPVLALQGRVHLNEAPNDPNIAGMVRLQVEMLFQLGVKNLITTCAAGGLGGAFKVGEVTTITSFLTLFAPDMPLWAGEFCNPEDTLDEKLQQIAHEEIAEAELYQTNGQFIAPGYENSPAGEKEWYRRNGRPATYAMLRGPFFEGRKTDKKILKDLGAQLVGMSTLPEACVSALYGVKQLSLAFVTNDDKEEHSHEDNLARTKKSSPKLGLLLSRLVKCITEQDSKP